MVWGNRRVSSFADNFVSYTKRWSWRECLTQSATVYFSNGFYGISLRRHQWIPLSLLVHEFPSVSPFYMTNKIISDIKVETLMLTRFRQNVLSIIKMMTWSLYDPFLWHNSKSIRRLKMDPQELKQLLVN